MCFIGWPALPVNRVGSHDLSQEVRAVPDHAPKQSYSGPERRGGSERREGRDRREEIRFDLVHSDRRSGFDRRRRDSWSAFAIKR
jgi:hypothetical protein